MKLRGTFKQKSGTPGCFEGLSSESQKNSYPRGKTVIKVLKLKFMKEVISEVGMTAE